MAWSDPIETIEDSFGVLIVRESFDGDGRFQVTLRDEAPAGIGKDRNEALLVLAAKLNRMADGIRSTVAWSRVVEDK
jgi:hypothetical protein